MFKLATSLLLPTPTSNASAVLSVLPPKQPNLKPVLLPFPLGPLDPAATISHPGYSSSITTLPASSLDSSSPFFTQQPEDSFHSITEAKSFPS